MKTIFRILLVIAVFSSGGMLSLVSAQEEEGMVKYTPDFRFIDGDSMALY